MPELCIPHAYRSGNMGEDGRSWSVRDLRLPRIAVKVVCTHGVYRSTSRSNYFTVVLPIPHRYESIGHVAMFLKYWSPAVSNQ